LKKNNKKSARLTGEDLTAVSRKPEKNGFRMARSSYFKKDKFYDLKKKNTAPDTTPPDLISPNMASYITMEVSLREINKGLSKKSAKERTAPETSGSHGTSEVSLREISEYVKDRDADLGGRATHTVETPVIQSETVKQADTSHGVFVELDDSDIDGAVLGPDADDNYTNQNLIDVGGHMTQTLELPIIQNRVVDQADTNQGVFVELNQSDDDAAAPDDEDKPSGSAANAPEKDSDPGPLKNIVQKIFPARLLAFLIGAAILFMPLSLYTTAYRLVYVIEDGVRVSTILTSKSSVEEIFESAGLELRPEDEYETEEVGLALNVHVVRSVPVTVKYDGLEVEHYVLLKTVSQALDELGVILGDDDEVNLALDTVLRQGDTVEVFRVRYESREMREKVSWRDVEKPSPLISEGNTMVMNPGGGKDGEAIRVYRDKYVNGKQVETILESEKYTTFPHNVVTLVGDPAVPASPIDGSEFCDIKIVDNKPESYEWVMERGVCTAYSFKPGTFGASGMYLFQGFVAVDASVIPYGSLLYITSPNGKFVYGWAIAADTGTAMMEGYVDIDCFFETYRESALFGKKYLNVYYVKQLTQSELEIFAGSRMFYSRVPK